jgi:plasmid stabilization system protein ParE
MFKLEIWERAKRDVKVGFDYYEEQRTNPGFEFIGDIESEILHLQKYPEHYQIKYREKYRQAVLKRFPYIIIYEIVGLKIIIYSVFHAYQDPSKKP